MSFKKVTNTDLHAGDGAGVAVVLCSFVNPAMGAVAEWAASCTAGLHIHLLDDELRNILACPEPVHLDLPSGVRSMSLESGFFRGAYQLYRDAELRDLHFDLPMDWQTQYLSPNEGGSGNTTPLYIDFCFICLGWSALRAAAVPTNLTDTNKEAVGQLQPQNLGVYNAEADGVLEREVPRTFEGVFDWAMTSLKRDVSREELERQVVSFQRHFAGGKDREVEVLSSGGGTR
jgi:hypothetical protein